MIDYSLAYSATRKLIQNNRVVLSLSLPLCVSGGGRAGEEEERWSSQPGYTNDSLKKNEFPAILTFESIVKVAAKSS